MNVVPRAREPNDIYKEGKSDTCRVAYQDTQKEGPIPPVKHRPTDPQDNELDDPGQEYGEDGIPHRSSSAGQGKADRVKRPPGQSILEKCQDRHTRRANPEKGQLELVNGFRVAHLGQYARKPRLAVPGEWKIVEVIRAVLVA